MNIDQVALLALLGIGGLFLIFVTINERNQKPRAVERVPAPPPDPPSHDPRAAIRARIRRFGIMTIPIGLFSVLVTGFTDLYGLVIITVGAMSFYFTDDPSILILYAVTIFFSTLAMLGSLLYHGLLSAQPGWIGYMLGLSAVASYILYHAQVAHHSLAVAPPGSGRAGRWFPRLGLGLSAASLLGYLIATLVLLAGDAAPAALAISAALELATRYVAVVGLGLSLAAIAAHYPDRKPAWIGLAGSGLRLGLWVLTVAATLLQGGPALT